MEKDNTRKQKKRRVLSDKSMFIAFDRPQRGKRKSDSFTIENNIKMQLSAFMVSKSLEPLINKEIINRSNLCKYKKIIKNILKNT